MSASLYVEDALGVEDLVLVDPEARELPERVAAIPPDEALELLFLGQLVQLVEVEPLDRDEVALGVLLSPGLRQRRVELVDLLFTEVPGDLVEVDVDTGALLDGLLLLEVLLLLLEGALLLVLLSHGARARWRGGESWGWGRQAPRRWRRASSTCEVTESRSPSFEITT